MDLWRSVKEWSEKIKEGSKEPELSRSQYSLVSCGELTPGAVRLWAALPEEVKYDPALAPYRIYYEKEHGKTAVSFKDTVTVSKRLPSSSSAPLLNNNLLTTKEQIQNGHNEFEDLKVPTVDFPEKDSGKMTKIAQYSYLVKMTTLVLCWVFSTVIFLVYTEKVETTKMSLVAPGEIKSYSFNVTTEEVSVLLKINGPFLSDHVEEIINADGIGSEDKIHVWLERTVYRYGDNSTEDYVEVSTPWQISLTDEDFTACVLKSRVLELNTVNGSNKVSLKMNTTSGSTTPFSISYSLFPLDVTSGVIYSCVLLIGLYILIIFEVINRTMAAVLSSTTALAVLCIAGERPSLQTLVSWLDVETLLLLFSMMILVAVLAETGLFDYLAVFTFEVTKGKLWPLINLLSVTTAVLSLILDNVTSILLMTPVTIRLCEVMDLDPVPVLMSMVLFTNVGGTATPVGDPPNVIIASNKEVAGAGIDFTTFTVHMILGVVLVMIQTYIQIRYMYRDTSKLRMDVPKNIQELRQKLTLWRQAVDSLHSLDKEETIIKERLEKNIKKMSIKLHILEAESNKRACPKETFESTLSELKERYMIRDKVLLIKTIVVIVFVVAVFFLHSVLRNVSLGWTALLGAILLLILADKSDLEPILLKIEWSSLLFFAALFVFMEALAQLGFTRYIGKQTESLILQVDEGSRLAVALITLLWVSGLVSAFVDNVPLTTMMVRIVTSLGTNPTLNLPLAPLIWALSFGVCLGGNGTLIGASANVVCAGVAEQHGYKISFMKFTKVGFPVMIGQLTVTSAYLLICHCLLEWH